MEGYNKQEALQALLKAIKKTDLPKMDDATLLRWLDTAITLDFDYMEKVGVLSDGKAGDAFYDDDDAYDYIVDHLVEKLALSEKEELLAAQFVDSYMDCQEAYLEDQGLLGWE